MPEDARMQHRNDLMPSALPEPRRKGEHSAGVACRYHGYCTDSSMDLVAGLEVVELPAEGQWADTMPFEMEPLGSST
jgi:hypothetical protein